MQGLRQVTKLEAKVLFLRDPVVLQYAYVPISASRPVFGLPGFGPATPRLELGGQRPIDTVLPSIALAISVGVLAISALPGYLAIYREKGILRRLSTTPASPAMPLIAQVAVNLAMLVAVLVLVLGIGAAWLDMAMPASVGWFVVAFGFRAAALFAVGLLVAAVAPTARAANAIGLLVFFLSLFLAGAWLPMMPAWLSRRRPVPARRLPRGGPGRLGRDHPGPGAPGRAGGGGGGRRARPRLSCSVGSSRGREGALRDRSRDRRPARRLGPAGARLRVAPYVLLAVSTLLASIADDLIDTDGGRPTKTLKGGRAGRGDGCCGWSPCTRPGRAGAG